MSALPILVVSAPPAVPAPRTCKVCGRELPPPSKLGGRPSDFCPSLTKERSDCARLDERMREVARLAERIAARAGETETERRSLQKLKGYLWSEANAATNRLGKLVGAENRKPYRRKRSGWWRNSPV